MVDLKKEIEINPERVTETITTFIKEKVKSYKRDGVIFGLSGGIDSACIAALLSRAIDRNRILALIMPEKDSSENSVSDAKLVADKFDIRVKEIDITPTLESFGIYEIIPRAIMDKKRFVSKFTEVGYKLFPKGNNPFIGGLLGTNYHWMKQVQAYYRIKHRVRMLNLYYYGEQNNYLIVGTSNRSEDMTGFFVKYGDGAADIMPIASLYKTQVRQLSRWLKVPEGVINKPSSPDLLPGITDELAMRISYEKLDLILLGLAKNMDESTLAREAGVKPKTIEYVKKLMTLSWHMRNLPEECKAVGSRSMQNEKCKISN
jgi:NAD+ synthase